MKMVFLPIEQTYGWQKPFQPVSAWPWNELNFTETVGLNEVTPQSIEQLMLKLKADDKLALEYLAKKIGFDVNDPHEFEKAMDIYKEFGIITEERETYPYFCYMSQSILADELKQCIASRKPQKKEKNLMTFLKE